VPMSFPNLIGYSGQVSRTILPTDPIVSAIQAYISLYGPAKPCYGYSSRLYARCFVGGVSKGTATITVRAPAPIFRGSGYYNFPVYLFGSDVGKRIIITAQVVAAYNCPGAVGTLTLTGKLVRAGYWWPTF